MYFRGKFRQRNPITKARLRKLSLLSVKANSYGLAVLLSPLMYIYDRYQVLSYICVGIAVFIFAFTLTTLLVNVNNSSANRGLQKKSVHTAAASQTSVKVS